MKNKEFMRQCSQGKYGACQRINAVGKCIYAKPHYISDDCEVKCVGGAKCAPIKTGKK